MSNSTLQRQRKVRASISIKTPILKVWKTISGASNLEMYHPFCKKNPVKKWGSKEAEDSIEYYNGHRLYRKFTDWQEGKGYALVISSRKNKIAHVIWNLKATHSESTELSIEITTYIDSALRRYPRIFRSLFWTIYGRNTLKTYLENVVMGCKYFTETGIPVQENQFGANKMFSARKER
ncbi:MAG: hypothetical protein ACPH2K_00480 [Flavicella sp.]